MAMVVLNDWVEQGSESLVRVVGTGIDSDT